MAYNIDSVSAGCYISFYHHLPIWASKVQIYLKTLAQITFYLPPKEKELFFVLKVICPQYSFSLPESGNCYFLVVQNACPNQIFTRPGQSGKCFKCSTLLYCRVAVKVVIYCHHGVKVVQLPSAIAILLHQV